jgi:hypothetical protein
VNILLSQLIGDLMVVHPKTHGELQPGCAYVIQQGIYYASAIRQFGQAFIGTEASGATSRQDENSDAHIALDLRCN